MDDDRHLEALIALHKAENNIDYLSEKYKVTKHEYISWLNALVGLLLPVQNEGLFLGMVDEYFKAPELGRLVYIYYYDADCVLLPDCGTLEITNNDMIIYGFNVTSKIFIFLYMPVCKDFSLFKTKKRSQVELDDLFEAMRKKDPNVTSENLHNYFIFEREYYSQTNITYKRNDGKMLDIFNSSVQKQSKQYYFSSSPICL